MESPERYFQRKEAAEKLWKPMRVEHEWCLGIKWERRVWLLRRGTEVLCNAKGEPRVFDSLRAAFSEAGSLNRNRDLLIKMEEV